MSGLFITFEGIEGCGKTTQIKRLANRLDSLNHNITLTREPGGTDIGEAIREIVKHPPEGATISAHTERQQDTINPTNNPARLKKRKYSPV